MPRQHGYRVLIECFVPSDPADIDRLGTVAAAIKKAQKDGEPADLLALGAIEEIRIKSQHRTMPPPLNTAQADQDDKVRAEGKAPAAEPPPAEERAKPKKAAA